MERGQPYTHTNFFKQWIIGLKFYLPSNFFGLVYLVNLSDKVFCSRLSITFIYIEPSFTNIQKIRILFSLGGAGGEVQGEVSKLNNLGCKSAESISTLCITVYWKIDVYSALQSIKETLRVISSDTPTPWKDDSVWFTRVPLNHLPDK